MTEYTPYKDDYDYVGPASLARWIPRRPFGFDFNRAAHEHDDGYTWAPEGTRNGVDRRFRQGMYQTVKTTKAPRIFKAAGYVTATAYWAAVRLCGSYYWRKAHSGHTKSRTETERKA